MSYGHSYATVGKYFAGFRHSGAAGGDSNGNCRPSGAAVGKHWGDSGGQIAPLLLYFVNSRRTFAPVEAFNGA